MSAFVVEDIHINVLVTWAKASARSYRTGPLDDYKAEEIAQILYAQNVRSYNSLYREEGGDDYTGRYKPIDYIHRFATPVVILKMVAGYEYQASEDDGWNDSKAKEICEVIRGAAIVELDDYEDAPWCLSNLEQLSKE